MNVKLYFKKGTKSYNQLVNHQIDIAKNKKIKMPINLESELITPLKNQQFTTESKSYEIAGIHGKKKVHKSDEIAESRKLDIHNREMVEEPYKISNLKKLDICTRIYVKGYPVAV